MTGTFIYLTWCSFRNRIRVRLRRLREPRYLIGLVVGLAYMYFVLFARGFSSSRRRSNGAIPGPNGPITPGQALANVIGPVQFIGSVVLLLFAVLSWLWPGPRRPIDFTRSEVQFLFTGPVTRRQLLHYKLMRSQLALLSGSIIATLILRPGTFVASWTLMVGVWIVLTVMRLHSIGVSLSRASLAQGGSKGLLQRWGPIGLVVAGVATLAVTAGLDWPVLSAQPDMGATLKELERIWSAGVCGWILWPFRTLVMLPLSGTAAGFLRALPGSLAILALCYVWILQADTAFEEAAADRAEKLAALKAAPRAATVKSVATPFKLGTEGRAEMAIMWKNLIMIGRFASAKVLLRVIPIVVIIGLSVSQAAKRGGGMVELMGMITFMMGFMTILMGPQIARNDLRQDLTRLAVLKSWPIKGATLLRGEIAAPAALLTGIVWIAIAFGVVLITQLPTKTSTAVDLVLNRLSYGIAAALLAPAIILVQLVVLNGLAVMFPAWIAAGSGRSRGLDTMGQRLVMMLGLWLSIVVALIPAVLIGGGIGFAIYASMGVVPVIVPAFVGAAVIVAECWAVVELLGRTLERTDVNSVEPTEGS